MTKKPETRLVARIVTHLETKIGGYWVKIHGSEYQKAGLPDLIGCVDGLFFGLEVKRPGRTYDPLQEYEATEIKTRGKGVAACVHSPAEAVDVVRKTISKTKRRR